MIKTFDKNNFHPFCNKLAKKDPELYKVIEQYSYPPLWKREPSFATLIHIILEQQVSLASAKAAFNKLQEKIRITPERILQLTEDELKACYFSRQKIKYSRHLAATVLTGELSIEGLAAKPDDVVKHELKKIKGIGEWTADIFLMICLNRCDCFPAGDIALIKSFKEIKPSFLKATKEEILHAVEIWKPYRTIAAYLLWHTYIKKRNLKY